MVANEIGMLSRRNFLRCLGIGAAGTAGASLLGGCAPSGSKAGASSDGKVAAASAGGGAPSFMQSPDPIAESEIKETIDTEVLIVGGGIAGSATASSCVEQGLSVVVIEKLKEPRAMGLDYGFVNPSIIAEKGLDPVDEYELTRDHIEKSCGMCRGDKVYRFMHKSGEAGDWWIEKAKSYDLEPQVMGMRSMSDHYKNNYIVELWHKGVNLGEEEDIYAPLGEMLTHVKDEVEASGSEYRTETRAVQLIKADDGSITGAVCEGPDGYIQVNASKGVVLAAGDYAMDDEMLRYYTCLDFDSFDEGSFALESTGEGDGHKMGLWAGARMQDAPHPQMLFMGYAYGYLRVNRNGERYVNEDSGYTGGVNAQLQQPGATSFAIWDAKWPEEIPASLKYAGGMSWDQDLRRVEDEWTAENEEVRAFSWEREMGLLMQADTLEELAAQMGLDDEAKATFLATVDRYNECAAGGDTDFGKRPELMTPITTAPFYALRMNVELGVSVGGLVTNADSECLDDDGKAIKGLYSVGNNAGGMFGVDYNEVTVPGVSLARSVTFGYLLGKHLAEAK